MHAEGQTEFAGGRRNNNTPQVVLNSWNEIARYLRKSVATVRRLEAEQNLPVRRRPGRIRVGVFALATEVDAWLLANSVKRNQNPSGDREFRLVWENSPDAMMIVDESQKYVDANPAACTLLARTRDEIIGRTIQELTAGNKRREQLSKLWRLFLRQGEMRGKWAFTRGDGGTIQVVYTARARHLPGRHFVIIRPFS